MRISGREVFRFAVTRMVELIEQAEIDAREQGLNGIDVLIPHQVNQRIIDAALESGARAEDTEDGEESAEGPAEGSGADPTDGTRGLAEFRKRVEALLEERAPEQKESP